MVDVVSNINKGVYKNTAEYPNMPKSPVLAKNATRDEILAYADAKEAYGRDMEIYKKMRSIRNDAENNLKHQLKHDLEAEFGVSNNPKKDLLWDIAWDRGHDSGFFGVYQEYSVLYELIL